MDTPPYWEALVGEKEAMARLWAKTTTFESISIGDELPIVVKWETTDTIETFLKFLSSDNEERNENTEEDSLTGAEAASQALLSYVTELLEKAFPLQQIVAGGSSLDLELLIPVKPEDTISLSGKVVDKGEVDGLNLIKCQVLIENQDNQLVAEARATISL